MRVPVLCYHRIEHPPAANPLDTNYVTPTQFASHLTLLARMGCTGVTIRDVARWLHDGHPLPARPVAITFDDAYASIVSNAIPQLDALGWPSTIYVVASQIGGTNAWDVGAQPSPLLDADTLRRLAAAGHEIGSHSLTHRRIRGLDARAAMEELHQSRRTIEASLGAPVVSFAFPYGSHDRTNRELLRSAGYRAAVTLKRWANGSRADPLRLGRISVGGPLPAWQLGLKIGKAMLTPSRA